VNTEVGRDFRAMTIAAAATIDGAGVTDLGLRYCRLRKPAGPLPDWLLVPYLTRGTFASRFDVALVRRNAPLR
jgi:hypothetical protein